MKYLFICAVHNLVLECENILIECKNGYISNKKDCLNPIFENSLSYYTLGTHSIDEIKESDSFYIEEGELGSITTAELNRFGTQYCFVILRQLQLNMRRLWLIKDNAVYIRDGFLYTYEDDLSDGFTFKGSLSAINTFADGSIKPIVFTDELKNEFISNELCFTEEKENLIKNEATQDYRKVCQHQHLKSSKLTRKDLANMYIAKARAEGVVAMKVLLYCSALEALVSTSTTELSHRVAERIATLLGNDKEERCEIYNNVKTGYDVRSKVAHGDLVKKDREQIERISTIIDEYLRKLIIRDKPYCLENKEMDRFFLEKLMS